MNESLNSFLVILLRIGCWKWTKQKICAILDFEFLWQSTFWNLNKWTRCFCFLLLFTEIKIALGCNSLFFSLKMMTRNEDENVGRERERKKETTEKVHVSKIGQRYVNNLYTYRQTKKNLSNFILRCVEIHLGVLMRANFCFKEKRVF